MIDQMQENVWLLGDFPCVFNPSPNPSPEGEGGLIPLRYSYVKE